MKTLIIDGEASRIEVKDGTITIRFADEPNAALPAQTEVKATTPPWELKEFSSKGGSKNTKLQNEARALNAIKARATRARKLAERNRKSDAQIENEATQDLIGKLCTIAKRNEEAKAL